MVKESKLGTFSTWHRTFSIHLIPDFELEHFLVSEHSLSKVDICGKIVIHIIINFHTAAARLPERLTVV